MPVTAPPKNGKTPYWQFKIQIAGHQLRGSTKKTTKREAEAVERQKYLELEAKIAALAASGGQSNRLGDLIDRYWTEVGQHHSGADNTENELQLLRDFFGDDQLVPEITTSDVARLVAWRRGHPGKGGGLLANQTVNATIMRLKALCTQTKKWGVALPNEPDWGDLWLKKPPERIRSLMGDEKKRIDAETRDDYAPILEFARLTGLRKRECLIKWSHVIWEDGWIRRPGKGDKIVRTRITAAIRALLEQEMGNDPVWVFTYLSVRSTPSKNIVKGKRYPITLEGLKTAWRRIQEKAGLTGEDGFRFHDFRHDFATKLLRRNRNLKLVSKALNHADLQTTMRYAHVLDDDLADALEDFHAPSPAEKRQNKRQTKKAEAA